MIDWPWTPDPDVHRLLRALCRQGDPARVPFLELFADPEIIGAVLEEPVVTAEERVKDHEAQDRWVGQKIRFWHRLGYDAFWQGPALDWWNLTPLKSTDTAVLARENRSWVNEKAGMVASWSDFERYPWPSCADVDFHPLEYAIQHLPEGMAIIGQISGILEPVMWVMGYEAFAIAIYEQPDLVEAIFDRIAEIYLPLARSLVEMDRVAALWMGDDMGFKTGTMISPRHLRKYVFPLQKQIAAMAHEKGLPFILHSCGNLEAVMEDLIEDVGIDAKHSYEDVIEPVEAFSARYSDRIAVIGGVDVDLLVRGTEAQIRARTRQVLEACAPSGSYVLGTGNSVANYIPPRNYLAMLDEGWRFNSGM